MDIAAALAGVLGVPLNVPFYCRYDDGSIERGFLFDPDLGILHYRNNSKDVWNDLAAGRARAIPNEIPYKNGDLCFLVTTNGPVPLYWGNTIEEGMNYRNGAIFPTQESAQYYYERWRKTYADQNT